MKSWVCSSPSYLFPWSTTNKHPSKRSISKFGLAGYAAGLFLLPVACFLVREKKESAGVTTTLSDKGRRALQTTHPQRVPPPLPPRHAPSVRFQSGYFGPGRCYRRRSWFFCTHIRHSEEFLLADPFLPVAGPLYLLLTPVPHFAVGQPTALPVLPAIVVAIIGPLPPPPPPWPRFSLQLYLTHWTFGEWGHSRATCI